MAAKLKGLGIPVVYLVAPQVWAWRRGRVRTMRRIIDLLLCIFPFEEAFFREHRVPVTYIGHPLARRVRPDLTRAEFFRKHNLPPDRPLIAVLPGSRRSEALRHVPELVRAAEILARDREVTFVLPASANCGAEFFAGPLAGSPIRAIEGEAWNALAYCDVALAAVGTVTVEAALLGAPMVTFYRVTGVSWAIGKMLVDVPFYSMVNLIAGKRVVPELMQERMTGENLAAETARLLDNASEREKMKADLAMVSRKLAGDVDVDPMRLDRICDCAKEFQTRAGGFAVKTIAVATLTALIALCGLAGFRQTFMQEDKRPRIDVESYTIDAQINPDTQTITARAAVRFIPLDDQINAVTFDLNNALSISRLTDDRGQALQSSRNQSDHSVRVTFPGGLAKNQPATVTFNYDGRLTGSEESPIYGIKFAAIQNDYAFLLYPARWFPVSGYTVDRFTATMNIIVPAGYTVIGSGSDSVKRDGASPVYTFQFTKPSFPGDIAVVKGAAGEEFGGRAHDHALVPRRGSGGGQRLRRGHRADDDALHRRSSGWLRTPI